MRCSAVWCSNVCSFQLSVCQAVWAAAATVLVLLLLKCTTCDATSNRSHSGSFSGLRRPVRAGKSSSARYQPPFNICTSDWLPMVGCDHREPADFDGYQIALWREIAADMGWVENEDWQFTCMDWDDMIDDLVNAEGNCAVAAAGVEVTTVNILSGIKFSWPFYKNGLQVMVSSHVEQAGMWSFFEVFDWPVWLLLVASAVALTIIITMVEIFTFGGLKKLNNKRTKIRGLRTWAWYIFCKMIQVPTHVGDPRTWAARIMVMGWAFVVLIILHAFTAKTAMKMSKQRLANSIGGPEDLPGRKVMSWGPYIPLLRRYRINADAMPWNNPEDEQSMLSKVHSHEYQALVLDTPSIHQMVVTAPNCDLFAVGDPFENFDLAIAYPPDVPEDLAANVSASLLRLQVTHGILDKLDAEYITAPPGADFCKSQVHRSSQDQNHNPQISLQQVVGLWYILAGAFAISMIVTGYQKYRHLHRVYCSETGGLISMPGVQSRLHSTVAETATAAITVSENTSLPGVCADGCSTTGRQQGTGRVEDTSQAKKPDMTKSGKRWSLFVTTLDSPTREESVPGYLMSPKVPRSKMSETSFSLDASQLVHRQESRLQGQQMDSSQKKVAVMSACTQTDCLDTGMTPRTEPRLQETADFALPAHAWPDLHPVPILKTSEAGDLDSVLKLSNAGG